MKTTYFTLIAAALALLTFKSAEAAPPPQWPVKVINSMPLSTQPVTGVTIGAVQIAFDVNTFSDVIAAFGQAPIQQQGDAGEFEMWVCYTLPAAKSRIWLISSELGGRKFIDGMTATLLQKTDKATSDCPEPTTRSISLHIDNGIGIGTSRQYIESKLGQPLITPEGVLYYTFLGKEGALDISSVLALKLEANTITEIHARHSATN